MLLHVLKVSKESVKFVSCQLSFLKNFRGQRRKNRREIIEKKKLLQNELFLIEAQKALLEEKNKLLEESKGDSKILTDSKGITDDNCEVKGAVFENPTEDDIKGLSMKPKELHEKKKE